MNACSGTGTTNGGRRFVFHGTVNGTAARFDPIIFHGKVVSLSVNNHRLVLSHGGSTCFYLMPRTTLATGTCRAAISFILTRKCTSLRVGKRPIATKNGISFASVTSKAPSVVGLVARSKSTDRIGLCFATVPVMRVCKGFNARCAGTSFHLGSPRDRSTTVLCPSGVH